MRWWWLNEPVGAVSNRGREHGKVQRGVRCRRETLRLRNAGVDWHLAPELALRARHGVVLHLLCGLRRLQTNTLGRMPSRVKSPKKPKAKGCERCNFTGKTYNVRLAKFILCVHCTRKPRMDKTVLKELTAAERRKVDNLLVNAPVSVARAQLVLAVELPDGLLTTDRVLQRWAVGHGSGLPYSDDELDQMAEAAAEHSDTFADELAKPPALDDATQTVIDQIVGPDPEHRVSSRLLDADPSAREYRRLRRLRSLSVRSAAFVWQWYCKPIPCAVMSEQRAIDEQGLRSLWFAELREVRGRLLASGHEDLVDLIQVLA